MSNKALQSGSDGMLTSKGPVLKNVNFVSGVAVLSVRSVESARAAGKASAIGSDSLCGVTSRPSTVL